MYLLKDVQVTVVSKLLYIPSYVDLYVGIKIVYAQIDVQVTVMYKFESVQITVVGLCMKIK